MCVRLLAGTDTAQTRVEIGKHAEIENIELSRVITTREHSQRRDNISSKLRRICNITIQMFGQSCTTGLGTWSQAEDGSVLLSPDHVYSLVVL